MRRPRPHAATGYWPSGRHRMPMRMPSTGWMPSPGWLVACQGEPSAAQPAAVPTLPPRPSACGRQADQTSLQPHTSHHIIAPLRPRAAPSSFALHAPSFSCTHGLASEEITARSGLHQLAAAHRIRLLRVPLVGAVARWLGLSEDFRKCCGKSERARENAEIQTGTGTGPGTGTGRPHAGDL